MWEFFNNFKDFLDIPKLSLEELQAALGFTTDANEPDLIEAQFIKRDNELEPFSWEQRMTMKEIREHGIDLVN